MCGRNLQCSFLNIEAVTIYRPTYILLAYSDRITSEIVVCGVVFAHSASCGAYGRVGVLPLSVDLLEYYLSQ